MSNSLKERLERALVSKRDLELKKSSELMELLRSEVKILNEYLSLFKKLNLAIIERIKKEGLEEISLKGHFFLSAGEQNVEYSLMNMNFNSNKDDFVFTEKYLYERYFSIKNNNNYNYCICVSAFENFIKDYHESLPNSINLSLSKNLINSPGILFSIRKEKEKFVIIDMFGNFSLLLDSFEFEVNKDKIIDCLLNEYLKKIENYKVVYEVYLGDLNE